MAIDTTTSKTANPTIPKITFCSLSPIVPSLNVVSMVDVSVSMETHAAAKLIVFEAENTGLLYFLYFTIFMIANVKAVNV